MYLSIILGLVSIILIIYIIRYKKEVKNITRQLREFKDRKSDKKINIYMYDKTIEDLAIEINNYLDFYKKGIQENIKFEQSIKRGIANISHDLRTPLTSIIGYITLIKNNQTDKEEALDIVDRKARKLGKLINDFFEFVTIEMDDCNLQHTKINLNQVLKDEILLFYDEFKNKNMKPFIKIAESPLIILAELYSVQRVLQNIISNVIKYGSELVYIETFEESNRAVLKISNICSFVSEEDLVFMFERFYMTDKARRGESSGLGLSIVKSLMEKMGGEVQAELEGNMLSIICQWPMLNLES